MAAETFKCQLSQLKYIHYLRPNKSAPGHTSRAHCHAGPGGATWGDASSHADRWQKAALGSVMPSAPCRLSESIPCPSRGAGTIVPIFQANTPKLVRLSFDQGHTAYEQQGGWIFKFLSAGPQPQSISHQTPTS